MNNSLIQKIVFRSNLTRLIWSLLGLAVVAGLFVFNMRFLYNFVFGPFDVTADQILQAESASSPMKYWINLQGDEMVNTGVQYITTRNGVESVEATYFVMPVGNRILLVRIEGNKTADTMPAGLVSGWLADIEKDENEKILLDIEQNEPALKGAFLPYKLQTGNFRLDGVIWIIIGVVLLGFSLWGLATVLGRMSDINSHPILKSLARFGPLDFVISGIENELAVPHTTLGKLHMTNSWLVYMTANNLIATRFQDVAWVYKFVFRQKSYGITVSKTFTAKVCDRFGVTCDFVAGRKEEAVNQMLEAICQRVPWAVMGYSDQLETAWKKDRQGFLAAVERRKAGVA